VASSDLGCIRLALQRPNQKLQPEEVDAVVLAYARGVTLSDLARDYAMHRQTIRAHLLRRGVMLRQAHVPKRYRS
jgi:hypothetical protein